MNTEKYIEMAIFVIITTLLSVTGSYFAIKKNRKIKTKKKKEKKIIINLNNIESSFKKLISMKS